MCQYCQAWVRLELDTLLAQQALREALDTKEVQEARERLNRITDLSHVRLCRLEIKEAEENSFLCLLFSCWTKNNLILCFHQRLDVVWRDARWIMDCLQCVRSRQWVGAVPLGLVMGGDPPARPDGEEEEECLTARLTWPHRIQAQRQAIAGTTTILRRRCLEAI